jgi:hypothetical protein
MNGKYVSVKTIGARIARNHKHLQFDIYDVVEWCWDVVKNTGMFKGFERIDNLEIEVKDHKALLPCNIYRLLNIYKNGCKVNAGSFVNDSVYINFDNDSCTKIKIDYLGIPVDKEGFPMVFEALEDACFWYCMTKLLFEDYISGKIDDTRYRFLEDKYGYAVGRAKSTFRWESRNDMDEVTMIMINMIPRARLPKGLN